MRPRSPSSALPTIRPMLLESGDLPDEDDRYLYEVKYDGWRSIVYADKGALRIVSRRGNDLTPKLPELASMAAHLKRHRVILDGELVIIGDHGKPDFTALSEKMLGGGRGQVCLMLFDILYQRDEVITTLPLQERKRRLADLELTGDSWRTASYSVGNGAALLAASREQNLEGLVAKRLDSKYSPGRRTAHWRKVKNFEHREVKIGGWLAHSDGTFGVLVGDETDGRLDFAGVVDIGIGPRLIEVLSTIEQPRTPFAPTALPKGTHHCLPRVIADIQWLAGADSLRHARLRAVRID
ncbi:MAG: ligD [Myxococcales bacterium]|nr:ligD [Myxococcales bacterium]